MGCIWLLLLLSVHQLLIDPSLAWSVEFSLGAPLATKTAQSPIQKGVDGNSIAASEDELAGDEVVDIKDRYCNGNPESRTDLVKFLCDHDKMASSQCNQLMIVDWAQRTNITVHNTEVLLKQSLEFGKFEKASWQRAVGFAWPSVGDPILRRWLRKLSIAGPSALPVNQLSELNEILAEMQSVYSTAKLCPYQPENGPDGANRKVITEEQCNLGLNPHITRIVSNSRDPGELLHVWSQWREATGSRNRERFARYVQLSNAAANLNGFNDAGEMWREPYESATLEEDLEKLHNELKPFYELLHAYVRRGLRRKYGEEIIKVDGPIPAHLLGNMWAHTWSNIQDIVLPYPEKPSIDVTQTMIKKNMTARQMFETSEEFFKSLGLKPLPGEFYKRSYITRPADGREMDCHPSAEDFCDGKDFRIKECTDITMGDLITVHHEMGHVQYFQLYKDQPLVFREGSNPGFHEAVGDTLALSVSTPKHLHAIGLLSDSSRDEESNINYLMGMALNKVAFLPYGYLMDKYRWDVFRDAIKSREMNGKWWDYRLRYQGVCPPVARTEADFDPAAKYHMVRSVPYIRYFVSFVIQFQMHKYLCEAAGHTGPLHQCDIYRSEEAGDLLRRVLELGSSKPWQSAMKILSSGRTGKMDAGPLLEFFQPLIDWLKVELKDEFIGWRSGDSSVCPGM